MLLAQDVGQASTDAWHVRRTWQPAWHAELAVVAFSVDLFQIAVRTVHVGDPSPGQFLWQSPLVGLERSLAPAACLRRVRGNVLDTQLLQRTSYLGQIDLVHFASRLGRGEVVAAPVGVQAAKQTITRDRLADSMEA